LASAPRALLPILAAITLASCVSVAATTNIHIVLPNPKLLGCESVTCSQLWLNNDAVPGAKYPKQLRIDFSDGSTTTTLVGSLFEFPNGVPYGLTAVYDKSVTIDDVEASIVGFGFDLPKNPSKKAVVAPIAPRFETAVFQEVAVSA
jgi:hypothetical protein